jgi:N-acetylglutamate synthase-like GNAT family acetyltransferase
MVIRQLPFEEWDKLEGYPIAQNGLPDPDVSIMLVAETPEGEIVGTWSALAPIILEGLWVKPEFQKTSVLPKMFTTMKSLLKAAHIDRAYTLVQTPEVKALAEHGGFEVIPGDLCVLDLDKA